MALVGDPVRSGIVASLAQPGGDITGVRILAPGMVPKRLELLKEAVPQLARVAALEDPSSPSHAPQGGAWRQKISRTTILQVIASIILRRH
jgi:ABC-type uncharacterized transport system substrate-binding protein